MFSVYHIIWMGISAVLITGALIWLQKYHPPLKNLLTVCCILSVISELIKMFSMVKMVPSSDGSVMNLYIENQHLPLHLCSLQIILIFYARFAKEGKAKTAILGFMYPTCVAGAFFAILLPSILNGTIPVERAFTHPLAYQYFLYHCMLIVLGMYILLSKQVRLQPKHCLTTLGALGFAAVMSFYTNSMFADVTYVNGELVSVDYVPNFFFVFETPVGIALTELWQWYCYLAIIVSLAVVLITTFYIPVFVRAKREKLEERIPQ